jgi:hypothetical protein
LAKFGTKGSVLFLPLYNTKPGDIPPYLHFSRAKKIADVTPAFLKMVNGNEDETWLKCRCGCFSFLFAILRSLIVPSSMCDMILKYSRRALFKKMAGPQTRST